jgi:hypothetical protein
MNTSTSSKLFEEAQKHMPGGVNSPVRAFKSVGREPLYIKNGEGRENVRRGRQRIYRLRRFVGTDDSRTRAGKRYQCN